MNHEKTELLQEAWRCVGDYPRYEISSKGNIRQTHGRILRPYKNSRGYLMISLVSDEGIRKSFKLHRLVAINFIGVQPIDREEVNHINGNKSDNRIENLEWVSRRENVGHRLKSKTQGAHQIKSGRWHARATINNKVHLLGTYDTQEQASAAYINFLKTKGIENKYATK